MLSTIGPAWLYHPLGVCPRQPVSSYLACRGYNFFSGIGSDLQELAIAVAILSVAYHVLRHFNCQAPRCWRISRHHFTDAGGEIHRLCSACRPDAAAKAHWWSRRVHRTLEEIHELIRRPR